MVIASYFVGQFSGVKEKPFSVDVIINTIIDRIKDLIGAILFCLSGLVLGLVGFFVAYFNILSEFDRNSGFSFGAVAGGGLFLVLLGLLFIYLGVRLLGEKSPQSKPQQTKSQSSSTLEQAISLLILDFVKERESRRESQREAQKQKGTDNVSSL